MKKAIVEVAFFLFVIIVCCSVSSCSSKKHEPTEQELDAFYAGYILGNVDGCNFVMRLFELPEEKVCGEHKMNVIERVAKKIEEDSNEEE